MQSRLYPLPIELRAPRSARADDRRMLRGDRRAPGDAGVLRQHRRRRAHGSPRFLGDPRLRDRARRRRQVLDERIPDHRAGRRPRRGQRLPRRPDLAGWSVRCGERRDPRSWIVRHRDPGARAAGGGGCTELQDLGRDHAREHGSARRLRGARRPFRRAAAADAASAVGPRRGRLGQAASDAVAATTAVRLAASSEATRC